MNKYKLVGIVDLFFGVLQLILSIFLPYAVFYLISRLYPSNVSDNFQFRLFSAENSYVLIILFIAIINIFLGIKSVYSSKNNIYFKFGFVAAIINFLFLGIFISLLGIKFL
jgi:hypothetical protein